MDKLLSVELLSINIASKLAKLCSAILLIALSIVCSALKKGSITDTFGLITFSSLVNIVSLQKYYSNILSIKIIYLALKI